MLAFRDRLRTHDDERDAATRRTKRELAARDWTYVQDYADAKGEVVEGIIARATRRGRAGPRRVDSERATRYRPGTHMSHPFYFRCPA